MTWHGVWVVDKPSGPTSHGIVARARRTFRTREVGHAGTLDPMASGVLLLLFGEACKLSEFLAGQDKRYLATVSFGRATDSFDAQGQTTELVEGDRVALDRERIEQALSLEADRQLQQPPAVSAIQVGGRRAYALARLGQAPPLAPRAVRVERLVLTELCGSSLTVELAVSKGYYVRALARDLGERLGIPAHLSELRRLSSGSFGLAEARAAPTGERSDDGGPHGLIPVAEAVRRCLPCATLTEQGEWRARRGQVLRPEHFASEPSSSGPARTKPEVYAWLSASGELIALGSRSELDSFRVKRGFLPPSLSER